jgi:hypothetical protein
MDVDAAPASEASSITDALRQHYPSPEPSDAQLKEQELHEAVAEVGRRRAERAEAAERAPKVTIEGEQLEALSTPSYLRADGTKDPKPEAKTVREAARDVADYHERVRAALAEVTERPR